jgi:hypothetical protein
MIELLIQLKGEEEDLDALRGTFDSPIYRVSKEDDGYYYLRSSYFTPAIDEENREVRAAELLMHLNVAARLLLGANYFYVEYDGLARIEEDGKRYRSAGAYMTVSYQIRTYYRDANPEEAESLIAALDKQNLSRVVRLLASSLDSKNDKLRRFIFGWTALEIFVNKFFDGHRQTFVSDKTEIPTTSRYSQRVASAVETGEYKPLDKFIIIAAVLIGVASNSDIVELDDDADEFQRLKRIRNEFFHGEDISENTLPDAEVREFLSKYMLKHINYVSAP